MANPLIYQIAIGNTLIDRPPDFRPMRQDLYAGEITTCTGKIIADRIGWKYADMTLTWPALKQSDVNTLIAMSGAVSLTFWDHDGQLHEESVVRTSTVGLRNRNEIRGTVYWRDVTVTIRFLNPHTS